MISTSASRCRSRSVLSGEARVGGQVRPLDRVTEQPPQLGIAGTDHHQAVARCGRSRTARSTDAGCPCGRRRAGREGDAGRQRHRRENRRRRARCRWPARDRCDPAPASASRMPENMNCPARKSVTATPTREGSPSAGPVMSISPGFGLHHRVVAGFVAPRPGVAVAGDRRVDEPRVERRQACSYPKPAARACPAAGSRPARRPRGRGASSPRRPRPTSGPAPRCACCG